MKILQKSQIIRCCKQKRIGQYLRPFIKNPQIRSLLVDDKFVTDMKTKADIFNKFFAEQCTPLKNDSELPSNQIYSTQSRLVSLNFNEDEILKFIRALMMIFPLE